MLLSGRLLLSRLLLSCLLLGRLLLSRLLLSRLLLGRLGLSSRLLGGRLLGSLADLNSESVAQDIRTDACTTRVGRGRGRARLDRVYSCSAAGGNVDGASTQVQARLGLGGRGSTIDACASLENGTGVLVEGSALSSGEERGEDGQKSNRSCEAVRGEAHVGCITIVRSER